MKKKVGQFTVMAGFYMEEDQFGESYVIKGDNSFVNMRLENGRKYKVTFEEIEDK